MKSLKVISSSATQTRKLGSRLGELAMPGDVFLLVGKLGAGKTCFTQGIATGLGITEYTTSPSFVLIREYPGRLPLYHIDLYRLERIEEIMNLGLDDYLYGSGVSVVEWADRGLAVLPEEHLLVTIEHLASMKRSLTLAPRGARYGKMLEDFARVRVRK